MTTFHIYESKVEKERELHIELRESVDDLTMYAVDTDGDSIQQLMSIDKKDLTIILHTLDDSFIRDNNIHATLGKCLWVGLG